MSKHDKKQGDSKNQGEGNREAARHYNEKTEEFVKSGQVDQKAREAADVSKGEEKKLRQAEEAGKSRAKEEDPAVKRNPSKPTH